MTSKKFGLFALLLVMGLLFAACAPAAPAPVADDSQPRRSPAHRPSSLR